MTDDPYDIVPSLSRDMLISLIMKQKDDIERLLKALKPFANGEYITDAHLRAARAAMGETE